MTKAAKLKQKLTEKNMTQRQLSKLTGIDECVVSRMVHNDYNSREEMLKKLSKALDCTIEEII